MIEERERKTKQNKMKDVLKHNKRTLTAMRILMIYDMNCG
jgi:hypothetical protein